MRFLGRLLGKKNEARGKVAEAIMLAFSLDTQGQLDAPELEAHLRQDFGRGDSTNVIRNKETLEIFEQRHGGGREGSFNVIRNGYRVRLAEQRVIGRRFMVPRGKVDEILQSNASPQEKTEAIVDYLDAHDRVGVGEPVRPYTLVPIGEIRRVFERFVEKVFEKGGVLDDELELESQIELHHRALAYGYVYAVAEELVRQGTVDLASLANTIDREPRDTGLLWVYFRDKPNTKDVLEEKAEMVAHLIASAWDVGLMGIFNLKSQFPEFRLHENESLHGRAETAVLLLYWADAMTFTHLDPRGRDILMDALEAKVGQALEDEGMTSTTFATLFRKRVMEYGNHKTPEKLFWEAAKNVAAAVIGDTSSALFKNHAVFTNACLVKVLTTWQLPQLLRGYK